MTQPRQIHKCLLIGAAGGIGRALTHLLAARGWELLLAGRSPEPVDALAADVGGKAITLDAADFGAVSQVFAENPGITAAANLAGSIFLKPAHATSAEEFDDVLSRNLRTAFALVRAAGQAMRFSGGSVVLMSSCAATVGLPNHEAVSAAKAGVEGLVRSAAATHAPTGLRFNAVAPGLVDTRLADRITKSDSALRASIAMHPLGRIAEPQEVARCIEFLLSPATGFITGQVVAVDGGLSRLRTR